MRNAYRGSSDQLNVFLKIISLMEKSIVSSKKSLLPFQKGIVISSKSMISLFKDLKDRYDISYIITRRMNQNVIEHFFGIVRQMNRTFDHPCPVCFQQRMKNFILCRKNVLLSVNPNTNFTDVCV